MAEGVCAAKEGTHGRTEFRPAMRHMAKYKPALTPMCRSSHGATDHNKMQRSEMAVVTKRPAWIDPCVTARTISSNTVDICLVCVVRAKLDRTPLLC